MSQPIAWGHAAFVIMTVAASAANGTLCRRGLALNAPAALQVFQHGGYQWQWFASGFAQRFSAQPYWRFLQLLDQCEHDADEFMMICDGSVSMRAPYRRISASTMALTITTVPIQMLL